MVVVANLMDDSFDIVLFLMAMISLLKNIKNKLNQKVIINPPNC